MAGNLLQLLEKRQELIKRINDLRKTYNEQEFDGEDVIPGHDTTTPLLLENHQELLLVHLKEIDTTLRAMGWRPNTKKLE